MEWKNVTIIIKTDLPEIINKRSTCDNRVICANNRSSLCRRGAGAINVIKCGGNANAGHVATLFRALTEDKQHCNEKRKGIAIIIVL